MNDYRDYDSSEELRELELAEQLHKKAKKRSRMMLLTALLVGAVLLGGLLVLIDQMFLQVEEVSVVGCDQVEEVAVAAIAKQYAEGSLLFVNGRMIEQACKLLDGMVADVSVEKRFPNTVVITVKEEEPLFYSGYRISEDKTAYIVVAKSLKVLKILPDRETAEERYPTLTEVYLPQIAYCAAGEVLRFEDGQNARILPEVVEIITGSTFKNELSYIDFTTRFDIRLYSGRRTDGGQAPRYEIRLGNRTQLEKKLTFAQGILAELSPDFVGMISVEDPNSGYADPE